MSMFIKAGLALVLAGATASAMAEGPACTAMKAPYRTGLWEVTSTTQNSMMKQPMTNTMQHCVTPKDVENACNMNNMTGNKNRDCTMTDFKLSGNHASWTMSCKNPHFMADGHGESTFSPEAYSGSFDMTANMQQGMTMKMNTTFKGRRIGDCK